jgi:hypothetical protein
LVSLMADLLSERKHAFRLSEPLHRIPKAAPCSTLSQGVFQRRLTSASGGGYVGTRVGHRQVLKILSLRSSGSQQVTAPRGPGSTCARVKKNLRRFRSKKTYPCHCINVCIQVLAKCDLATHIRYWDIRVSIRRHFAERRVLLPFDFNGNFAKIPPI